VSCNDTNRVVFAPAQIGCNGLEGVFMRTVSEERMRLRIEYARETELIFSENIPAYADWLEKKLSMCQRIFNSFVAIAKPNYKSKDGSIKHGILIDGSWYAPKNDCYL
jgi:hypothetical protein